jgi:hypothetical protein
MKNYTLLLLTFVLMYGPSECYAQETVKNRTLQLLIDLEKENNLLKAELDSLEKVNSELKLIKNKQIDELRSREATKLSLAAVLTLVSLFLILFVFMYLSIRRRRRMEVAELEEKLSSSQA